MSPTPKAPHELPLRERKKEQIRRAIIGNAERLFEAHGYDQVTVAQIADASDVSVKTLFTYFRSKEDLLFQDDTLIEALLGAIASRPPGETPARAVAGVIGRMVEAQERALDELERFHRGYGSSEALRSRVLRMWAEDEDRVAALLAGGRTATPEVRLHATLLVGLVRSLTWVELKGVVADSPSPAGAIQGWVERVAGAIDRAMAGL